MFFTLEATILFTFEDSKIKLNLSVTLMQICFTEEKNTKYFAGHKERDIERLKGL